MSSESKLYTGVVASAITGILLLLHLGSGADANTIAGYITDIVGGLLTIISAFTALDGLLFKHKAEVSSQHLLDAPSVQPTEPVEPTPPPAQAAA